ncbi:TCEA3 [Branchiostoma lanceolatum]|uniref:TCEA3 protein n=1 Tax=Branchiostoma lanceolatum TaxID=7740 RepID=A0A8J9YUP6_BRALA|nr:TCEA3 [Branchiostoma lanceolatum]
MADSEENRLISISNQLNAMVTEGQTDNTLTILRNLRDEDISVKLLKKTQIGRAVNNVRRNSSNAEVISLAKKIVNKWKRSAESQICSVVSTTGELPSSQMSQLQMTEETQMSQSMQTAGHPKPEQHHIKGAEETEVAQDSESLLAPSNRGALLLFQTETCIASTQKKNYEKEDENDSDRETSHEQRQDNHLSQQAPQSSNSECQHPDKPCQSYTENNTTTGNVEGISTTSSGDEGMSRESGSDDSNSRQTHLFCCNPSKERRDSQSQQPSVRVEQMGKNTARIEDGQPRVSTSTNGNNSATTQNTSERPLTELQSLRKDVSQIQTQVARIESVLAMLFTPLKQNLDRVSRKLSSLEQQTVRNSQNASSSHDALSEAETQAYPDWLGTLDGATSSSGPSFSLGTLTSNNTKTRHPQSSSQHSSLPQLSLKVKSEPLDPGYDLASANQSVANDEMSVSQETEIEGSPSQLLFPQMTEDGGIRFESLTSEATENKTTVTPKPGPSTEPDIIPRKKPKLEHHSKESHSSWLSVGFEKKLSPFQSKCSDVAGLKVVHEGTDSDDDLSGSGHFDQEGVPGQESPPVVETPDNPSASSYEADFGDKETFADKEESQPPQRVALERDFRPQRVKWLKQHIKFSTYDHRIGCAELKSRLRQHFGYTSDQELGHAVREAFPDVQRKRRRVAGKQGHYYACLQWMESSTPSLRSDTLSEL